MTGKEGIKAATCPWKLRGGSWHRSVCHRQSTEEKPPGHTDKRGAATQPVAPWEVLGSSICKRGTQEGWCRGPVQTQGPRTGEGSCLHADFIHGPGTRTGLSRKRWHLALGVDMGLSWTLLFFPDRWWLGDAQGIGQSFIVLAGFQMLLFWTCTDTPETVLCQLAGSQAPKYDAYSIISNEPSTQLTPITSPAGG